VSLLVAGVNPWRYHTHPELWLVIGAAAGSYWYAITRVGPRVVDRGAPVVTRRQVAWFVSGLLVLWLASDWPLHDFAEDYLYSAHMVQHLLISLVAPPMLLLGVPDWLTRRLLAPRALSGTVRVLCRPLVAAVLFNIVIALSHAPFYVNFTLNHHFWHFWAHLLLFVVSMLMWFPVVNKLPEYPTMSPPLKMVYLFLQSIIPNVPVAFLTLSTGVVYTYYAHVPRPFAISVLTDQQTAGAIMKVGGTTVLWSIIMVVFFRWYGAEQRADAAERAAMMAQARAEAARAEAARGEASKPLGESTVADMPDVLTWDHVAKELAKSQPAQPGGGVGGGSTPEAK
jgi:putative membrane protein